MENIVHAHELLHLIMDAKKPYTMEELEKIVPEKFSKGVKFTNCTENLYSLNEILSFLAKKIRLLSKTIRFL